MADNPVSIAETLLFVALMLGIVKIVVDALEAAPIGFESEVDDYVEEAADRGTDLWGATTG